MPERKVRYAQEIKKEIAALIQRDIKDPRIPEFTSIVHVDVAKDLSICKVYISTLGTGEDRKKAVEGLKSASGYIKRELGHRVKLRAMPELVFLADDSIEHGIRISKLIDDTLHGDKKSETK
jgi:ribosome-binding factor A